MGKYDAKKKPLFQRNDHPKIDKNTTAPDAEEPVSFPQWVMDCAHDLAYMFIVFLIVCTFLTRFVIVSGSSMYSTLVDGDYLLVLNNPICGELEQGDIVVASLQRFRGGDPIVKRVIATEGQVVDIDFQAGIVYVDGMPLDEPYTYTGTNYPEGMAFPLRVKEGCVFLMGDNRNNSKDSRSPDIGLVDTREILGKAIFLMFPGTGTPEYPAEWSFGRIGGLD